jgi:hypothetical protein
MRPDALARRFYAGSETKATSALPRFRRQWTRPRNTTVPGTGRSEGLGDGGQGEAGQSIFVDRDARHG